MAIETLYLEESDPKTRSSNGDLKPGTLAYKTATLANIHRTTEKHIYALPYFPFVEIKIIGRMITHYLIGSFTMSIRNQSVNKVK